MMIVPVRWYAAPQMPKKKAKPANPAAVVPKTTVSCSYPGIETKRTNGMEDESLGQVV